MAEPWWRWSHAHRQNEEQIREQSASVAVAVVFVLAGERRKECTQRENWTINQIFLFSILDVPAEERSRMTLVFAFFFFSSTISVPGHMKDHGRPELFVALSSYFLACWRMSLRRQIYCSLFKVRRAKVFMNFENGRRSQARGRTQGGDENRESVSVGYRTLIIVLSFFLFVYLSFLRPTYGWS